MERLRPPGILEAHIGQAGFMIHSGKIPFNTGTGERGADDHTAHRPSIFVHLAREQDSKGWAARWRNGTLIGINDPSPYGYLRAQAFGCHINFSTSSLHEGHIARFVRLGIRALLGFDLLHALGNAKKIRSADVVWTHTEFQYLAVACLLVFSTKRHRRPGLIGQTVWLTDKWYRLNFFHRSFHAWLIRHGVDMLTFMSPDNLAIARKLFPHTRSELVLFGIPGERKKPPRLRPTTPIKVIAVGNDMHRDWESAIHAVRDQHDIELTIISTTASAKLPGSAKNIRICKVSNNNELFELFEQSTVMLVPLHPNTHASGITVIQEAALMGLPVIATDTGGLRAYFDDNAVLYVPPGNPQAIREALRTIPGNAASFLAMAHNAQHRMGENGLGAQSYIARYIELSKQILPGSPEWLASDTSEPTTAGHHP